MYANASVMKGKLMKITIFVVCLALVATMVSAAELTLFENDNFNGRRFGVNSSVSNLASAGFNDRASSVVVRSGTWQVCDDAYFRGHCVMLQPGEYPSLRRMGMNDRVSSARELSGWEPRQPSAGGNWGRGVRAVLYEGRNFSGRSYVITDNTLRNLGGTGFNDRASSLRVEQGYWMFCSDADYNGECLTFGPGEYPNLPTELSNRISSARRIWQRYPYNQNPTWGSGDAPFFPGSADGRRR
jgi:Beta/Gamma crystallin